MITPNQQANKALEAMVELLDIPLSYYEKSVARYESIAKHLERKESTIAHLSPTIYPQGSFRLGTVIRPLNEGEGYDLDLVCRINGSVESETQKSVKEKVGVEVKSYSKAQGFKAPPSEGKRCWTQQYQDEVDFHMDVLPSIPHTENQFLLLERSGVAANKAKEALAITDNTSPNYRSISSDWPISNPKGYALWFEEKMDIGGFATSTRNTLFEQRGLTKYASVDEVPSYELKTPLQRCVQILKRHRDQMFKDDPDDKPISILISTLAGRAYEGENNLADALQGILNRMEHHVKQTKPRVENPVNPEEDFTDRWTESKEANFWTWLRQAKTDFNVLTSSKQNKSQLQSHIKSSFGLTVATTSLSTVLSAAAPSVISSPSKVSQSAAAPWGDK